MKKQLAKLALTAALGLAITLLACEDKEKKQTPAETQTAEPAAAAETQQPSQEAAAEKVIEVVKGSFTDPRDDKTYKTVKIGEQVWMAENLNYAAKGSKCGGTTDTQIIEIVDGEEEEHYTLVEENTVNCDNYGRLYDWQMAKSACPSGWKLPSKEEWNKLVGFVGGEKTAGKYLKATSGWNENGNGTDKFGFSALPGAGSVGGCCFGYVGNDGNWWTATASEHHSNDAQYLIMHEGENVAYLNIRNYQLRSVRCIKD